MNHRLAVYYAPPREHPLWQAGCAWLQRDPEAAEAQPPTRAHIHEPWRYGFHATLKPPLRLAAGRDDAGFVAAVARLAQSTARFVMPALSVQWLAGFLALLPAQPLPRVHPLQRLADACVTELDAWRAPPTPDELQRRQAAPLSEAQVAYLQRYGYPHVLDQWRLHITLSDTMAEGDAALRAALQAEAQAHFAAALRAPLVCDALCVYAEPAPGQPFRLLARCPLA